MTNDRAVEAAARRDELEQRAEELQELRLRLVAGGRVTGADVDVAVRRLDEAAGHASEAHRHAARAHDLAARAHRRAALVADDLGDAAGARGHRQAAEDDDALAAEDRRNG